MLTISIVCSARPEMLLKIANVAKQVSAFL